MGSNRQSMSIAGNTTVTNGASVSQRRHAGRRPAAAEQYREYSRNMFTLFLRASKGLRIDAVHPSVRGTTFYMNGRAAAGKPNRPQHQSNPEHLSASPRLERRRPSAIVDTSLISGRRLNVGVELRF